MRKISRIAQTLLFSSALFTTINAFGNEILYQEDGSKPALANAKAMPARIECDSNNKLVIISPQITIFRKDLYTAVTKKHENRHIKQWKDINGKQCELYTNNNLWIQVAATMEADAMIAGNNINLAMLGLFNKYGTNEQLQSYTYLANHFPKTLRDIAKNVTSRNTEIAIVGGSDEKNKYAHEFKQYVQNNQMELTNILQSIADLLPQYMEEYK